MNSSSAGLNRHNERLTDAEMQTLDGLVRQYEQTMLVRAQATALLKERGHESHLYPASFAATSYGTGSYRCGYCLTSEAIVGMTMEIDHIIPESLGGPTEEEKLWLACSLCKQHSYCLHC